MACALVAGLGPAASGWLSARAAERQFSEACSRAASLGGEEAAGRIAAAREANLSGGAEALARGADALDFDGTGAVAWLEVPRLSLSVPVFRDCADEGLMAGAGLVEGSALPVGGASCNVAVAGHSGMPGAWMFDRLDELGPGDEVVFHVLGERVRYEVEWSAVVPASDASALAPVPGEDVATLVTCRPVGVNSHRLVVRASRADGGTSASDAEPAGSAVPWFWPAVAGALAAAAARAARRKGADAMGP